MHIEFVDTSHHGRQSAVDIACACVRAYLRVWMCVCAISTNLIISLHSNTSRYLLGISRWPLRWYVAGWRNFISWGRVGGWGWQVNTFASTQKRKPFRTQRAAHIQSRSRLVLMLQEEEQNGKAHFNVRGARVHVVAVRSNKRAPVLAHHPTQYDTEHEDY